MTTKNKEGTRRRNVRSTNLYLGSFFDESLPGREKQHRHRKSTRNKMIRTKVSVRFYGRSYIVASTKSVRHSLWRFGCPKSEWSATFGNTDTDFSKVSVRKVGDCLLTYTLLRFSHSARGFLKCIFGQIQCSWNFYGYSHFSTLSVTPFYLFMLPVYHTWWLCELVWPLR
jgi:hypothetical protein